MFWLATLQGLGVPCYVVTLMTPVLIYFFKYFILDVVIGGDTMADKNVWDIVSIIEFFVVISVTCLTGSPQAKALQL